MNDNNAINRLIVIAKFHGGEVTGDCIKDVLKLYRTGWTDDEIVAWLRCTEEINPRLAEDTALQRMREVQKAVEKRLGSEEGRNRYSNP